MTSPTRCECLSLNSVFSIAARSNGHHLAAQYTTPPFKNCARVRRCSSRGPDCARLHDGGAARGQLPRVSAARTIAALHRASPRTPSTKTPIRSSSRNHRARCGRTTPDTRRSRIVQCAFPGRNFVEDPEYTFKLEGVRHIGYSTILMGGVRDPYILSQIDSL
jgi:hypothetical protein